MLPYKWIAPCLSIVGAVLVATTSNTLQALGYTCWIVANLELCGRFVGQDVWLVLMYIFFLGTSIFGFCGRVLP